MSDFLKGYIVGSIIMLVASICGTISGQWLARRKVRQDLKGSPKADRIPLQGCELYRNALLSTFLAARHILGEDVFSTDTGKQKQFPSSDGE